MIRIIFNAILRDINRVFDPIATKNVPKLKKSKLFNTIQNKNV